MTDFFAELEAEIATTLAEQKRIKSAETLRKKSNNQRLPKHEREAAKQSYLALERELQAKLWRIEAEGALFLYQRCSGCGSSHKIFLQFMVLKHHLERPVSAWERVAKLSGNLPRRTLLQPHDTTICADCSGEHLFDEQEPITLHPSGPILPPRDYEPEDLNSTYSLPDIDRGYDDYAED